MSDHPIRRADVQAEIERKTEEMLAANNGAGKLVVEFDFNRRAGVRYWVHAKGAPIDLATKGA